MRKRYPGQLLHGSKGLKVLAAYVVCETQTLEELTKAKRYVHSKLCLVMKSPADLSDR